MKKLLLSTAALLGIAASIFGGYYYYVTNDLQETEVGQYQRWENKEGNEATDREIPYAYRSSAWHEEDGSINPNGLSNAVAQREFYLASHKPPDGFGNGGVAKGPQQFRPIGPQNLGGRTEAILLDPDFGTTQSYRGIMWAGGASGGVWKSFNSGKSWNAMNGVLQNYNVSCLAFDPQNPDIIYAGTGAHDLHGDGIFRSTNGGVDWEPIRGHAQGWLFVSSISVARIGGNTVVLAAVDNDSSASSAEHGIMRGVINANNPQGTWAKLIDATQGVAVGSDPNDYSKAVASVCYNGTYQDVNLRNKCKAYYSTQSGALGTWSASTIGTAPEALPGPPPFESPRDQDTIHFAFQKSASGSGTVIYAQYGSGIGNTTVMSRSTNGGAYFSKQGLQGTPDGINRGVPAFWVSRATTKCGSHMTHSGGGFRHSSLPDIMSIRPLPFRKDTLMTDRM